VNKLKQFRIKNTARIWLRYNRKRLYNEIKFIVAEINILKDKKHIVKIYDIDI